MVASVLEDRSEMEDPQRQKPWERLGSLIATEDVIGLRRFLKALPAGEVARAVSRVAEKTRASLWRLLGPEESADLLGNLSDAQAVKALKELELDQAAAIIEEMPSADRADLLGELNEADTAAILELLPHEEAADARRLLQYPPDTAGGVMITEYVSYPGHVTVEDVVEDLWAFGEHYSDYEIQYAYITGPGGELVGVLRLRDLLLARPDLAVSSVMLEDPVRVEVHASLSDLKRIFDSHPFFGMPAVDPQGRLVGVVRRAAVEEALGDQATEAFLAVSGLIGADELRTMPLLQRSRRRLSWLSINIVLNILAASVIAYYQDTLAAVIALAVFLPMISDMSGCSGNQAVAVSIRELALGLLKPYEFARVIVKEGTVGIINGFVLGVLLGGVAALWQGNVYLGLVVGAALTLNTILAVLLGGLIPLALKSLNQDPALASGPILTTATDMMGFLMVLGFASTILPKLV